MHSPLPLFMANWSPKGDFPGSSSSRGETVNKGGEAKKTKSQNRIMWNLARCESRNAHLGHSKAQVTPGPLLEGSQPQPAVTPGISIPGNIPLVQGMTFHCSKDCKAGEPPQIPGGRRGLKPPGKGCWESPVDTIPGPVINTFILLAFHKY